MCIRDRNIHSALQVGREGLWLTIASISTVLVLGYVIGRWFHMRRKMSHLVASGTAICGGSAIAAVAPAVKANEKETSVSLGVVFLLNSVALLLFPLLGHWLGLTQHQFGLWSAIAIHDTSSVVGASSAYGSEALNVATTVKLARALWIIPVSLLSALLFRSSGKKVSIPWFIGFFIVAMLLNSYLPFVGMFNTQLVTVSKACLLYTSVGPYGRRGAGCGRAARFRTMLLPEEQLPCQRRPKPERQIEFYVPAFYARGEYGVRFVAAGDAVAKPYRNRSHFSGDSAVVERCFVPYAADRRGISGFGGDAGRQSVGSESAFDGRRSAARAQYVFPSDRS